MHPRGRIRSLIKRTGVVATALLLIVGVASGWYGGYVGLRPTIALMAWGGQLRIIYHEPWLIQPRDFDWGEVPIRPKPPVFRWRFDRYDPPGNGGTITHLCMPFWFLILLTGVPTLLVFRADRRRARNGHCPNCGYSRTGLPTDRPCPECGFIKTA